MATREENLKRINAELESLSDEQLEQIAGGNNDEAKLFRKIAVEKGWAISEVGMASGMAANKMLEVIGIPHVNWHTKDNVPADFWDNNGNHYDFATVMEKINSLPNKSKK